jgi:hypothetical protein
MITKSGAIFMDKKEESQTKNIIQKKKYIKPQIQSEKLNSYGAVCNGTTVGGRKASSSGPAFCNAARLMS